MLGYTIELASDTMQVALGSEIKITAEAVGRRAMPSRGRAPQSTIRIASAAPETGRKAKAEYKNRRRRCAKLIVGEAEAKTPANRNEK